MYPRSKSFLINNSVVRMGSMGSAEPTDFQKLHLYVEPNESTFFCIGFSGFKELNTALDI